MRLFPAIAAIAVAVPNTGLAVGSETQTPPAQTETTATCSDGQIWDADKQECGAAQESGLTDDVLFDAAREFAHAGQYEHALNALDAMLEENTARILNYRGFANRKAGRHELGMSYYRRALALDPDHHMARSYMGQALAERGDLSGARMQLREIRARGGRDSWAYESLRLALAGTGTY